MAAAPRRWDQTTNLVFWKGPSQHQMSKILFVKLLPQKTHKRSLCNLHVTIKLLSELLFKLLFSPLSFPSGQFQSRPPGLKLRLAILYSPYIQFQQKHQVSIWSDFAERALRLRAGGHRAVLPNHIDQRRRCSFSQISRKEKQIFPAALSTRSSSAKSIQAFKRNHLMSVRLIMCFVLQTTRSLQANFATCLHPVFSILQVLLTPSLKIIGKLKF